MPFSAQYCLMTPSQAISFGGPSRFRPRTLLCRGYSVARFLQKFSRLSVSPNKVVKFVESMITMSLERCPGGGRESRRFDSLLPAEVKDAVELEPMAWRRRAP